MFSLSSTHTTLRIKTNLHTGSLYLVSQTPVGKRTRRTKTEEHGPQRLCQCFGIKLLLSCIIFIPAVGGLADTGWAQSLYPVFSFTGYEAPTREATFRRVFPEEGVRLGPLHLHPFLGFAEIFTDNAFATNTRRKSEFRHVIASGIQAQLPFRERYQFTIDYRARQQISQRFSSNNVLSQDVIGQFTMDFPGGLEVALQGGHTEGFDARGSQADGQNVDLNRWNTNTFISRASLLGNSAGIRLTGSVTEWNFENNNQDVTRDRLGSSIDLTFFASLTPNISALLDFGFSTQSFTQNKQLDSFVYSVAPGLKWDITERTTGEIHVGYQVLRFDRAPVTQPPGSRLNDGGDNQSILFASGAFTWNPTSRLLVSVAPFRTITPGGVSFASSITTTGVYSYAQQKIGTRTALIGTFNISDNKFSNDPEGRRDLNVGGILGLEYQTVKWLGFRLDYRFQQRASKVSRFDFYSNTVMLSIQGKL